MIRLVAGLSLLAALLLPAAALAHGGTVVFDQNVGAYGVAVLHSALPESGEQIFTVYLTEPDNGPEVAGASITLAATGPSGDAKSAALAPEPDLAGYYEAQVSFPTPGTWQVELRIDGPRGAASAIFPVLVPEVSQALNISIWAIALLPIILAAGVLLFFWIRSGREPFTEEGVLEEEAGA